MRHPAASLRNPISLAFGALFIRPLPFQHLQNRRDPALIGGADAIDRRPAWRYEVCTSRDQQRLIVAVSEHPYCNLKNCDPLRHRGDLIKEFLKRLLPRIRLVAFLLLYAGVFRFEFRIWP